jgi:hypothetical protein
MLKIIVFVNGFCLVSYLVLGPQSSVRSMKHLYFATFARDGFPVDEKIVYSPLQTMALKL